MTLPPLVDSHCHLDFEALSAELDEVVARARRAGVVRMVTIGTKVREFDRVLAIAERYDDVFCSVGTHPHQAGEETGVTADQLVALAESSSKVVGIGECGLDYFYDSSPRAAQAAGFRTHIEAARRTGLPVIVHSRDADEDTFRILEEGYTQGAFTGVLHCFSSGRDLAMRAVELGMYVSLSGILAFKKSEELRAIVADLPPERLLVETDAPYLAPPPYRGKRNEPAYVVHTHQVLAEVLGLEVAASAELTTRNFFRLFRKVPPPAHLALEAA